MGSGQRVPTVIVLSLLAVLTATAVWQNDRRRAAISIIKQLILKINTMKRSELNPLPEYFDRYINQCDDVSIGDAISTSLHELDNLPIEKWKALGDKVYAPGKWTVKDILQHLADTERIFSYRALAFARQETQRPPNFPEDEYAAVANAAHRTIESLVEELKMLRRSYKALYDSFTPSMLNNMGLGFKGLYSVASIGYIVPGHQRWHMRVLEEKYYPLLKVGV